MTELITTKYDLCTGCNRCVRECPVEMANVTYQDAAGNIRVKTDHTKCIHCGWCITACKHKAREYKDDTVRFFDDLAAGIPISLIAAPSIQTNIPEYQRLFTYLKSIGVGKIFDVSLGADICIWAHVRHFETNGFTSLISQPCPPIVSYCQTYRKDLLDKLAPLHSPMACTAIYMKDYEGIGDRIAALSPCIAKSEEFESTKLVQYNVTFGKLLRYLEEHHVEWPLEETGFDHDASGLGSLFPMPGGLKENIEFYFGRKINTSKAEGAGVFDKLDLYAETPAEHLPEIFEVLSCSEGCNVGSATSCKRNLFEIDAVMNHNKNAILDDSRRESLYALHRIYDQKLDLSRFRRQYHAVQESYPVITGKDLEEAFELLGKTNDEKQHVDCGACGSRTCYNMARKIALGVNIPVNCIFKTIEDAKKEHEENLVAREKVAAMEKFREADHRMRVMLEASPHIKILFDSRFRVIDCNLAAVKFMRFEKKEELLAGFLKRIAGSLPAFRSNGKLSPIVEKFVTAARKGFARFETEITLDNTERSLNVELKRIPYEDSFAIVAYVIDMTDIRERERELARARELNELQLTKLNLAVQATKIGLWDMEIENGDLTNPNNTFTWSDEFRHLLGFSDKNDFPDTLCSWSDRLHPDDKTRIFDCLSKHLLDKTGKTLYDVECRMLKKNGEYAHFRVSGQTLRDASESVVRAAGSLMDITETKSILFKTERLRIEAEAANKAKTEFLSTMSHEIRTPMNAILGIAEIQLRNTLLVPEMKDALGKIYEAGNLLLSIINDLLDLSKIEAGKLKLALYKYDVASMINDVTTLNMVRTGSRLIDFQLFVDENTPSTLIGDELRIKQVLNNLLSNAFKYTEQGMVYLSVFAEPEQENRVTMVFEVRDTGMGMTQEQVDRLFDEYTRFNTEANRKTEGTGLGMSITRNLLRLMNGKVTVRSELNKGSVFTVRIPQEIIHSGVLGRTLADNLQNFRTDNTRQVKMAQIVFEQMPYAGVLIVDDVEVNLRVATGLLTPYGVSIDTVMSGYAAIEKIREGHVYDIVFMDHMMPGMDGIEATKIIREMGYKHPIVALTANAVLGQSDIILANGFDDFVSKPVDIRQLNAVLKKFVRDKQLHETLNEARQKAKSEQEQTAEGMGSRLAEIFLRDTTKAIATLDAIQEKQGGTYDEEDLRKYTISTHGMKSALANFGKKELSARALQLETAARNGEIPVLVSETPAFLDSLRELVAELSPKGETDSDKTAVQENRAYLHENLLAIQAASEEYDERTVENRIAALREKTWSTPTKELLNLIAAHLLHSDFDEIGEAVNRFMENAE